MRMITNLDCSQVNIISLLFSIWLRHLFVSKHLRVNKQGDNDWPDYNDWTISRTSKRPTKHTTRIGCYTEPQGGQFIMLLWKRATTNQLTLAGMLISCQVSFSKHVLEKQHLRLLARQVIVLPLPLPLAGDFVRQGKRQWTRTIRITSGQQ